MPTLRDPRWILAHPCLNLIWRKTLRRYRYAQSIFKPLFYGFLKLYFSAARCSLVFCSRVLEPSVAILLLRLCLPTFNIDLHLYCELSYLPGQLHTASVSSLCFIGSSTKWLDLLLDLRATRSRASCELAMISTQSSPPRGRTWETGPATVVRPHRATKKVLK